METIWRKIRHFLSLLKDMIFDWYADKGALLAAGISYFTMFSYVPMFLLLFQLSQTFIPPEHFEIEGQLRSQIEGLVGERGTETFFKIIESARDEQTGLLSIIIGVFVLTFGASHLFVQIRNSLKIIWQEELNESMTFLQNLLDRAKSLLLALGAGVLIFIYLVISSVQAIARQGLERILPEPIYVVLLDIANLLFLFIVVAGLFLLFYRYMPGVDLTFKDVLGGAILGSVLFTFGRLAVEYVLIHSRYGSVSGVAGSVLFVLIWFYYSALVFLLGAEFSKAYATRFGSRH